MGVGCDFVVLGAGSGFVNTRQVLSPAELPHLSPERAS